MNVQPSARPSSLHLPHGPLDLPQFLPDATRGVVRAIDSSDLEAAGVAGLMMSLYHLMQRPGSSTVRALGGLHRMAGWRGPIMTDSGGFQIYSLIRQNPRLGRLDDDGALFRPDGSKRLLLTPEKSIRLQLSYGADILVCLDVCTHPDDRPPEQERSVELTLAWARRSKAEFTRVLAQRGIPDAERPLLFAVIQGGRNPDLRRRCAAELLEIGFDGFGFGGWPLDRDGNLLFDSLALTSQLVPPPFPLHALGVGHPESVVRCAELGYGLFDSALPTRDARRGRLYGRDEATGSFDYVYVADEKHVKSRRPILAGCGCPACARYSLGYLHHLFRLGDPLFARLATMHNLTYMSGLMSRLRSGHGG